MTDWGGREERRAVLSLGGEREEARTGPTRRNMEVRTLLTLQDRGLGGEQSEKGTVAAKER